jgi:arsenate reductase-like glutaredoxin family protein
MKVSNNELILIYNSSNLHDRETVAFAKSLKHHEVKAIDVQKSLLTETQLMSIANKLEVEPEDLIDRQSTFYLRYYFDAELSQKEALKVLKQNPAMINTPIVLYKGGADFVGTNYDFANKDLNFKSPN